MHDITLDTILNSERPIHGNHRSVAPNIFVACFSACHLGIIVVIIIAKAQGKALKLTAKQKMRERKREAESFQVTAHSSLGQTWNITQRKTRGDNTQLHKASFQLNGEATH